MSKVRTCKTSELAPLFFYNRALLSLGLIKISVFFQTWKLSVDSHDWFVRLFMVVSAALNPKSIRILMRLAAGALFSLRNSFLTQLLTYAYYIWVIFWRFFIFFLHVKFILLRIESDKTSNPGSILYHDRALFSWELVRIFISFFFRHEN